jgi:hypothetical protein
MDENHEKALNELQQGKLTDETTRILEVAAANIAKKYEK